MPDEIYACDMAYTDGIVFGKWSSKPDEYNRTKYVRTNQPSDEWMPIASAPLDGTYILVAIAGAEFRPSIAQYKKGDPSFWINQDGKVLLGELTHWMPLKEPPQ
jgi:hypothetical protein